jgi:LysM repeat protein
MSVAPEFAPDVHIPAAARLRVLRPVDGVFDVDAPIAYQPAASDPEGDPIGYYPVAPVARPTAAVPAPAPTGAGIRSGRPELPTMYAAKRSPVPAAPAAAALGAGVLDPDRWRHHYVGAQAGDRRRIDAGLRIRPVSSPGSVRVAAPVAPSEVTAPVRTAVAVGAPVRLTRRGLAVIAGASAVVALALVGLAWLSAPTGAATAASAVGPAVVTVGPGDSLWSIASAAAPNHDPRVEIAKIQQLNHLAGDTVAVGQQLRVR